MLILCVGYHLRIQIQPCIHQIIQVRKHLILIMSFFLKNENRLQFFIPNIFCYRCHLQYFTFNFNKTNTKRRVYFCKLDNDILLQIVQQKSNPSNLKFNYKMYTYFRHLLLSRNQKIKISKSQ